MVTEFFSSPDLSASAKLDLTFPWKPVSLRCWFDIWTGASGFAPHLSHTASPKLFPSQSRAGKKKNTEGIVSSVKTETTLIFCCTQ